MKNQALTTLALTGIDNLNANTIERKGHVASTDVCVVLKDVQAYHASGVTGLYIGKKGKGGTFSTKLK